MLTKFEQTSVLTVLDPVTDQPIDGGKCTITIAGPDSAEFARIEQDIARRRINKLNTMRKPKAFIDPEESFNNRMDLLVSCTLAWTGVSITEDGAELAFSKENARKVYAEFKWLADQVDNFIGDRANFLQK